jgi:hypothetical protein
MPQKKQQLKITMTCKRFALRKWRGLREGCTVVPSMRSTALLILPVYLHPPPRQQHKRTLNLAVKQNAELTTRRRSSFPRKTKKTGTREREKTSWGKQTGLELTRFMLKSRFIQIGKQSIHDDGDNLPLL